MDIFRNKSASFNSQFSTAAATIATDTVMAVVAEEEEGASMVDCCLLFSLLSLSIICRHHVCAWFVCFLSCLATQMASKLCSDLIVSGTHYLVPTNAVLVFAKIAEFYIPIVEYKNAPK